MLQQIFMPRYTNGLEQEILDVIDEAIGVYEGDRYMALIRTINPFHHAAMTLGYRHGLHRAEQARQLAELAERLDFAERMLTQQGTVRRIKLPELGVKTPT